jgi:hypothetical protein
MQGCAQFKADKPANLPFRREWKNRTLQGRALEEALFSMSYAARDERGAFAGHMNRPRYGRFPELERRRLATTTEPRVRNRIESLGV